MKLKLDDAGHAVLQDGKPVYQTDDGREVAADYPAAAAKITALNGEAMGHRRRADEAEENLKTFDGLDVAKAREALETVSKLDQKQLIDAGQVDVVKHEAQKAFETQLRAVEEKYKPVVSERDKLKGELTNERIGGAFNRSKFIGEKLAIPVDLAQAQFGRNFKVDGGKVVAVDGDGKQIFSLANPGQPAEFDEALEILVGQYPHRDSILKGTGASGGGAGSHNGSGNGKIMQRAAFDALSPVDRVAAIKNGTAIAD